MCEKIPDPTLKSCTLSFLDCFSTSTLFEFMAERADNAILYVAKSRQISVDVIFLKSTSRFLSSHVDLERENYTLPKMGIIYSMHSSFHHWVLRGFIEVFTFSLYSALCIGFLLITLVWKEQTRPPG